MISWNEVQVNKIENKWGDFLMKKERSASYVEDT